MAENQPTSIRSLVATIKSGTESPVDVVAAAIKQIQSANDELFAFISDCESDALAQADEMADSIKAGNDPGPLAGVPIAIKDGICTAGHRSTGGSKMLETFIPPYDATIVTRLKDAGAICIGKTNLDEFAMGSSTENSAFGISKNPWATDRVSGGSSGGSAAAVAGQFAPAAIGSDTGGSIRQPASFCGITGIKPTYGRVSRYGLMAFASSLDQIGPMAWSAEDNAILMNVLAGHDDKDSTSSREPVPDYTAALEQSIEGLRIGICRQHMSDALDDEVRAAVELAVAVLQDLGAEIKDVSLPYSQYSVATYYVVAPCEASSNLSRYDGVRYTARESADDLDAMYSKTRKANFGPEVTRRILLGTYCLSSGYDHELYKKASQVRRLIKQDYDNAFAEVDVIAGPTVPTAAFKIGQHDQDPLAMYLADIYTASANLAGVPAISLPCGFSGDGLPIGLQLQGNMFEEAKLLQAAHQYQLQTDWHTRRPNS